MYAISKKTTGKDGAKVNSVSVAHVLLLLLLVGVVLSVFVRTAVISKDIHAEHDYLSFAVTLELADESLTDIFYIFDIETNELIKIAEIPAFASYQPGFVDYSNRKIFYAHRTNVKEGDAIFALDIDSYETNRLTNPSYAFNYFFPLHNQILLSVGGQVMQAGLLDLRTNRMTYLDADEDDEACQFISYSYNGNRIIYLTYSDTQRRASFNAEEDTSKVDPPIYRLYSLSTDLSKREFVHEFHDLEIENIAEISSCEFIFLSSRYVFDDSKKLAILNVHSEETRVLSIPELEEIDFFQVGPNGTDLYIIGKKLSTSEVGIFRYSLCDKQLQKVISIQPDFENISNFVIIRPTFLGKG
ncbi:MAG: hypothetical protein LBJ07_03625 [Actinomycetes bacterium]|jgi:hypothetical protein|nr:hypothetical protein [Actinomycetes bacterium]